MVHGALDEENGEFCCGFQGSKLGHRGISRSSPGLCFGVNPVILGLFVAWLLIEKVCCSQESDCGTFFYNSACGVEGLIWLCVAMA